MSPNKLWAITNNVLIGSLILINVILILGVKRDEGINIISYQLVVQSRLLVVAESLELLPLFVFNMANALQLKKWFLIVNNMYKKDQAHVWQQT